MDDDAAEGASHQVPPGPATAAAPRLSRTWPGTAPAPPVRLVHLGVGAFHRAHQAWYTAAAPDAVEWGIAAFTGRRSDVAGALGPQGGLYTLITRSADGDRFDVLGQLAEVHPVADHLAYLDHLARPEVAVLTLTVTERGYPVGADGHLDAAEPGVAADVAALGADPRTAVGSVPARLVAGLLARRAASAGPVTVLPCDNLPGNGGVVRALVTDLADLVDPTLGAWPDTHDDFATSVMDRITPAATDEDRALVQQHQGYVDAAPVPTEPFSEWVVAGRFPAGRPRWEEAGARIVDDVAPFEQRKLWLLNGAHSLLAYAGSIRGHTTIDEAVADPACRAEVEALWDEAGRHLELGGDAVTQYREALLARLANPRTAHRLAQVAGHGSLKLPVRTLPPLRAERAAARLPVGCATTLAAWVLHLRGHGAPVDDPGADAARQAATSGDLRTAVVAVLGALQPGLEHDVALVALVRERAELLVPGG